MMYSFRIEQAIRAASVLHQEHRRRGSAPYPYVAHLFAVACIIADYTTDEDIIIAGLLHDALEDTDYTGEEMETDFGVRVRSIVEGASNLVEAEGVEWYERKHVYLKMLHDAPHESLLVVAANHIHNMRSIVEEYQAALEDYLTDFGGTLPERLLFYERLAELLHVKLRNPIMYEFNHVFDEYRNFIETHEPSV